MSKHNKNHNQPSHSQPDTVRMRLDKWLWAARFYRTRTLAKEAIESGRVHYAGSRVKTSKEIAIGDELSIRQGSATAMTEKTVIVEALSAQRGNATAAKCCILKLRKAKSAAPTMPNSANWPILPALIINPIKKSVVIYNALKTSKNKGCQ